jgi:hypothetical protein
MRYHYACVSPVGPLYLVSDGANLIGLHNKVFPIAGTDRSAAENWSVTEAACIGRKRYSSLRPPFAILGQSVSQPANFASLLSKVWFLRASENWKFTKRSSICSGCDKLRI